MRKMTQVCGWIGIVLFLFGVIAYLITQSFIPYVTIHLVAGALLMLVYGITNSGNMRTALGQRSTKYGANTMFVTIFVLAIVVCVNVFANNYSKRTDLTESKIFSLADQSLKVVKGLEEDVEILCFFPKGMGGPLTDLLSSYTHVSKSIQYRFIDPVREPEKAREHGINQSEMVLVRCAERETRITGGTEEEITNAIIKVSKKETKVIYYLDGHGEPDIEDSEGEEGFNVVREALENESYQVEKILLGAKQKVPEDSAVLLVAGPEKELLPAELSMIRDYLNGGGRAIFLLEPRSTPGLDVFLAEWGVVVGDDVVVDQVIRLFYGASLGIDPIVEDYGFHEITTDFQERTIFPLVRSVGPADALPEGLTVTTIASTSSESWAEGDIDRLFGSSEAEKDDRDKEGPISVALVVEGQGAAEGEEEAAGTRFVVFGDAEFVNNRWIGSYFNVDLFLNTVSWLVGEEELISIRPKTKRPSRTHLTADQTNLIFYLSVLIIPELLMGCGIVVWWRRR